MLPVIYIWNRYYYTNLLRCRNYKTGARLSHISRELKDVAVRYPVPLLEQLGIIETDGNCGISRGRGPRHRQGRRLRGCKYARVGLGTGAWIGPGRICI